MNAEDAGSGIRIALTGDFRASDGEVYFDAQALDSLTRLPGAMLSVQDAPVGTPLDAATLREFDAVVMKRSPVSADILESDDLRTVLIARNGVGVEHIDLEACTRRGVMVANTPESVRRPMASSAMTMILALAHRLLEKNRAAREGRWIDRHRYRGTGMSDRVLGLIGCGNIGMDLLGLSAPWGMERLVFDPYQDPGRDRGGRCRIGRVRRSSGAFGFHRAQLPADRCHAAHRRWPGHRPHEARRLSGQCRTRRPGRRGGADRGARGRGGSAGRGWTCSIPNRPPPTIRC